jgi:arginine repressor
MSLKEISAINEERRNGELTCVRSREITKAQLMRLEAKATELEMMMVCISNNAAFVTVRTAEGTANYCRRSPATPP